MKNNLYFCPYCFSDQVTKDLYAPYNKYYCDSCFRTWNTLKNTIYESYK